MAHLVSVKKTASYSRAFHHRYDLNHTRGQKWMQQITEISPVEGPELPMIVFYQTRLRTAFLVYFYNLII